MDIINKDIKERNEVRFILFKLLNELNIDNLDIEKYDEYINNNCLKNIYYNYYF